MLKSWILLSLQYINGLPNDIIRNIGIYADDTNLYSKFDQVSDLGWKIELASEFKCDQRVTVDLGSKWIIDASAVKIQLALFFVYSFKNTRAINVNDEKNRWVCSWGKITF